MIVDVAGFFRRGDGEAFHPLDPARIQDSRFGMQVGPYGSPWTDGETRPVHATGTGSVPADADSVVINATATNTTAASFLTVYPTGSSRSLTSSLNWAAGVTIANAMTAKVGTGGNLDVFNAGGSVDVVMDVAGYYR